jgi:hypothetical protein
LICLGIIGHPAIFDALLHGSSRSFSLSFRLL